MWLRGKFVESSPKRILHIVQQAKVLKVPIVFFYAQEMVVNTAVSAETYKTGSMKRVACPAMRFLVEFD